MKQILATGFELRYAVTALYFSDNFFIFLYRKETAMKKYIIQGYTTAKILSFNILMTELNFPWLNISIQGRRHVKNLGGDNPT